MVTALTWGALSWSPLLCTHPLTHSHTQHHDTERAPTMMMVRIKAAGSFLSVAWLAGTMAAQAADPMSCSNSHFLALVVPEGSSVDVLRIPTVRLQVLFWCKVVVFLVRALSFHLVISVRRHSSSSHLRTVLLRLLPLPPPLCTARNAHCVQQSP